MFTYCPLQWVLRTILLLLFFTINLQIFQKIHKDGVPKTFTESPRVPKTIADITISLLKLDPIERPSSGDIERDFREQLRKLKKNVKKRTVPVLDL